MVRFLFPHPDFLGREVCPKVTSTAVDVSSLVTSVTGMLGDFTTDNLIVILGAGVGIAAGLVLLWFGFNYIKRKLMGAVKKGKL